MSSLKAGLILNGKWKLQEKLGKYYLFKSQKILPKTLIKINLKVKVHALLYIHVKILIMLLNQPPCQREKANQRKIKLLLQIPFTLSINFTMVIFIYLHHEAALIVLIHIGFKEFCITFLEQPVDLNLATERITATGSFHLVENIFHSPLGFQRIIRYVNSKVFNS